MTLATDVRIVDATRDHIPFVAWVVQAASRSHLPRSLWNFSLDTDDEAEVLRYLEVFADTEVIHWGHWSQFIVAEVGGVPAAAMMGYLENEQPVQVMIAGSAEANQKLGRTPEEAAAGWQRAGTVANIGATHEPGAWVVEHVATHPDYRRRGLVDQLLAEILERGRKRGAKTAEIGVFIGNDKAHRAYEKAGFRIYADVRDAAFEAVYGCPGAYYLRRPL